MTKNKFHNVSFYDFLEKLKGIYYFYLIEKDEENEIFELSINSTSLSELDDKDLEKGLLGTFSYMERSEIFDDIQMARDIYGIDFDIFP